MRLRKTRLSRSRSPVRASANALVALKKAKSTLKDYLDQCGQHGATSQDIRELLPNLTDQQIGGLICELEQLDQIQAEMQFNGNMMFYATEFHCVATSKKSVKDHPFCVPTMKWEDHRHEVVNGKGVVELKQVTIRKDLGDLKRDTVYESVKIDLAKSRMTLVDQSGTTWHSNLFLAFGPLKRVETSVFDE